MKNYTTIFMLASLSLASAQLPEGYSIETIPLPTKDSSVLVICEKDKDTLAVGTWEGEIWESKSWVWTRFAEGLHTPNGLRYDAKKQAYITAQMPELTLVKDVDNDGVADLYQSLLNIDFNNDYHAFHYGTVLDSRERMYGVLNTTTWGPNVKGKPGNGANSFMGSNGAYRGWAYRTDRQGHLHPIASGFRSPCGIAMSPDDELFITDNQGDWVPACNLIHVREGGFYGHPASLKEHPQFKGHDMPSLQSENFEYLRTPPAIWFPRDEIANSPGNPVWDDGRFGFKGQIFIGDQRLSNIFRCGLEKIGGEYQGFCVDFLRKTDSGTVKMFLNDQHELVTAQVGRGWGSKGGKRSAIQKIKWDGKSVPFQILSASLTDEGFDLQFTKALKSAELQSLTPLVESWTYDYHSVYGSKRINKLQHPVQDLKLSEDGLSLSFGTELIRGRVYAIRFKKLESATGKVLTVRSIFYTVNKLRGDKLKVFATGAEKERIPGSSWLVHDGTRPQPLVVPPPAWKDTVIAMPEGAVSLRDKTHWTSDPAQSKYQNGSAEVAAGNRTTNKFGTAHYHIEFNVASSGDGTGQRSGNSGVQILGGHEIQILNSHNNATYADGSCGAIYGQQPPLVNAGRPMGEWQSYDLLVKAPVLSPDGGTSIDSPRVTIYHNGILIHDDVTIRSDDLVQMGSISLQDHGHPVTFRNIWVKPVANYGKERPHFKMLFKNSSAYKLPLPFFKKETLELARQADISKNLILQYNFNEDQGDKVKDASKSGLHGSLKGQREFVEGKFGKGLKLFKKETDFTIPTELFDQIFQEKTICFWFKETDDVRDAQVFFHADKEGKGNHYYQIGFFGGVFFKSAGKEVGKRCDVAELLTASWHHWAFVRDASSGEMFVYRDGEEIVKGGDRVTEMVKPDKIYIGKRSGNSNGVSGVIDDFRIYNKALSQGDIRKMMKSEQSGKKKKQ